MLATALARSSRPIDQPGWSGSVLRATWVGFAVTLVITTSAGAVAQYVCPTAITMPEAFQQCVGGRHGEAAVP